MIKKTTRIQYSISFNLVCNLGELSPVLFIKAFNTFFFYFSAFFLLYGVFNTHHE